jgi:hypothetical protein
LYPGTPRVGDTVLLTCRGWLPHQPISLDAIPRQPVLDSAGVPATADLLDTASYLVPRHGDYPFTTYAGAVAAVERPRLLEDRPTYRLMSADLENSPPSMSFAIATYFDVLNIEAAAHEYAADHRTGRHPMLAELPLRSCIGSPTDPTRRPMTTAITTLTLRHDPLSDDARFLVHWRDPAKVATNGGFYQLAPVGMFQPAGAAAERAIVDLDLWRCIVREYNEELLGAPEIEKVAYERWPFYLDLEQARTDGLCRPYLIGIGVDPLTLATDLLTVVVFDAATYDHLFANLCTDNAEGSFELDEDGQPGTPFDHHEVRRLVNLPGMQPAGAATLHLAWHHRATLLAKCGRIIS